MRAAPLVLATAAVAGCLAPAGVAGDVEPFALLAIGEGALSPYEPAAAVSPLDPRHVVVAAMQLRAADDPTGARWGFVHVSRDAGRSWTTSALPGGPSAGADHPLAAATAMADLSVAFAPDGAVVVSGFANSGGRTPTQAGAFQRVALDEGLFVARSFDGGSTFETTLRLTSTGVRTYTFGPNATLSGLARAQIETPRLALGADGVLRLAWAEIDGAQLAGESVSRASTLRLARSSDGGATWAEPVTLIEAPGLLAPIALATSEGREMALFHDQSADVARLAVADKGSWSVVDVAPAARWRQDLVIAGDPAAPRLLVGLASADDEGRQAAALVESVDLGKSWSTPLALSTPGSAGSALTSLAVDGAGDFFAAYYVAEPDGTQSYRASRIGPAGAPEETVLQAVALGTGRLGEYMGLAPTARGAFAAWVTDADGAPALVGAWLR